ncbi:MAG TPA: SRPBCC domain-containing protein [Galbitalea sp.]|jgi:carbon monoxide dehydrogenase subunit G
MMTVDESVAVAAAPAAVWPILTDPKEVVGCIPGAELLSLEGDSFDVKVTVKFGPMAVSLTGHGTMRVDAATASGLISGDGGDSRGTTRAKGEGSFALAPEQDGSSSRIDIHGTVTMSGPLAGVIERGASVVIARLTRAFAEALAQRVMRDPDGPESTPATTPSN